MRIVRETDQFKADKDSLGIDSELIDSVVAKIFKSPELAEPILGNIFQMRYEFKWWRAECVLVALFCVSEVNMVLLRLADSDFSYLKADPSIAQQLARRVAMLLRVDEPTDVTT
jgi:hypothetical protein